MCICCGLNLTIVLFGVNTGAKYRYVAPLRKYRDVESFVNHSVRIVKWSLTGEKGHFQTNKHKSGPGRLREIPTTVNCLTTFLKSGSLQEVVVERFVLDVKSIAMGQTPYSYSLKISV